MSDWEYLQMMQELGVGTGQRRSDTRDRAFNQGQRDRDRATLLRQRGFVPNRNAWPTQTSNYDYDQLFSDLRSSTVLPGYIPPGTHAIPSTSYSYRSRQPTPTGQGQRSGLSRASRPSRDSRQRSFLPQIRSRNYLPSGIGSSRGFSSEDYLSRDTLPLIDEYSDYQNQYGGGSGSGYQNHGFLGIDPDIEEDDRRREQFGERLASFPEVPLDAHRRIFQMGNEIVDCFDIRLERFYRGSLLDSVSGCAAVFTMKERTGQRWLMVFKEDITRTVVKFNRLLTHSLLVSIISDTAIEIEAAKALYGSPAEMCVINFSNTEESSRFYKTLQESQTTAWNHREVTQEQRIKNLYTRINITLARTEGSQNPGFSNLDTLGLDDYDLVDGMEGLDLEGIEMEPRTQPRTPFTLSLRNPCGLASNPNPNTRTPRLGPSASVIGQSDPDLDKDWRRRNIMNKDTAKNFLSVGSSTGPFRKNANSTNLRSTLPLSLGVTSPGVRMDGSGDGEVANSILKPIPEELSFEHKDVTVLVKIDQDYTEVGKGTLQLIDHKDCALDEVRLICDSEGDSKKEMMQQFVYKWNSALKMGEGDKAPIVLFDGAANFDTKPEAVPERRNFKVLFHSKDQADDFVHKFAKSVEKSKDDILRKRHISWYLQCKRDYGVAIK